MLADYSWLYSAVAQSCAAIVGLFGAFLLTKVVSGQAAFAAREEKLRQFRLTTTHFADRAIDCAFRWYNERREEVSLDRLASTLESEEEFKTPEEYYEDFAFSPFQPRDDVVELIGSAICAEEQRRRDPRPPGLLGAGAPDFAATARSIRAEMHRSLGDAVQAEREKIDGLAIEIRHHCRALSEFLRESERHPESSSLVTISSILTAVLFFAGVVWPLSFLPVTPGSDVTLSIGAIGDTLLSLKGAILSIVSGIFLAIVGVFVWMNVRLRIAPSETAALWSYTDLRAYSQYYVTQVANEEAARAPTVEHDSPRLSRVPPTRSVRRRQL